MAIKTPPPPKDSRAARLLRQKQLKRGLNKKGLALLLGVAPDTAQAIANGFARPRIDTAFLARDHFQIPLNAWMTS